MKASTTTCVLLLILGLFALVTVPQAQAVPPSYSVQFLGNGSPVALNNVGTVVGVRNDVTTLAKTPLISEAGGAWTTLPLPAGATSAFPTDVNDSKVIVRVADMPGGKRAVRWIKTESVYAVELLPLLPGELAAYATGINNLGQIVGARAGLLGTPYGFGWLYTDTDGLVDLNKTYGWFATPSAISDAGVILSETQTFDLNTRRVTDVGLSGPSNYNPIGGVAINTKGQIAGQTTLRSSSLNIAAAFRYTPGSGWLYIGGTSKYTIASDINAGGDMTYSEQGAGIYLDKEVKIYALGELLAPAARSAGWLLTGLAPKINDAGLITTLARNTITGQSGGVMLIPSGTMAPPAPPTNLTATPHSATSSEPYVSINLSWKNGDALQTRTYELERRVSGQVTWTPVALIPPAMSTSHQDTTVAQKTTYDYRVRAIGAAGSSLWSATATATSPSTPLDTVPPSVTILTPAPGATVSGVVSISAEATDNVGVASLEIAYWNQYTGNKVILGSVNNAGSLTANLDTSGLVPATYTVWAQATDALGNWMQDETTVLIASKDKGMKVTSITLSGRTLGTKVNITGNVLVKDTSGLAVAGVNVACRWTKPNGTTTTASAQTDTSGRASFAVSGPRGTYTLNVMSVTKTGYVFDPAGSITSRSITK
jgi:hypothetical protein